MLNRIRVAVELHGICHRVVERRGSKAGIDRVYVGELALTRPFEWGCHRLELTSLSLVSEGLRESRSTARLFHKVRAGTYLISEVGEGL